MGKFKRRRYKYEYEKYKKIIAEFGRFVTYIYQQNDDVRAVVTSSTVQIQSLLYSS